LVTLDIAARKGPDARSRVDARLAKTPNQPEVLVLAARTYATLGDPERAEQFLLKAIEVAPENLQAYGLLGQLYLGQNKLDQARERFSDLATRQPKPVGAETMVGMILQMQGKAAEAQKQYEKVLTMDARSPVAANNLAWMYGESGSNLDLAVQLAQTAKAGLPEAPEVDDTLGWVYYRKNLPGLALAPLQRAVGKSPKDPVYHYHLGMVYAKSGDAAQAKASLQKALALDPAFDGATEARKTLAKLR
jgi:tetratricopeptide (TPR) repeat protein